jgi:hypothetical protein
MAAIVQKKNKGDNDGIRVQFQGDRVQAFFHMPVDSADGFCTEKVNAALGPQSSFELVLSRRLRDSCRSAA